jgi:hypothetical protein
MFADGMLQFLIRQTVGQGAHACGGGVVALTKSWVYGHNNLLSFIYGMVRQWVRKWPII